MNAITASVRATILLVLLALGLAAHDAAMASGPMPGQTIMADAGISTMPDPHADHHCCGCKGAGQNCCFTGQCLIGVAPTEVTIGAPAQVADRTAPGVTIPFQMVVYQPYRPPASA